jgi:imidazolonepropionase-like amidohydrolase
MTAREAVLVMLCAISSLFAIEACAADKDRWTIIHAGTLLAEPGSGPASASSIVIRNDRIVDIRRGFVIAADITTNADSRVTTIDLSDKFVLPGLMDSHVHLTEQITARFKLDTVTRSPSDRAVDGVQFAWRTLMAGFTTVRDVHAEPEAIFALRNGIRTGRIVGPRIVAAGSSLSPTGGHSDADNGYRPDLQMATLADAVCDGPDNCRQQVRLQIKFGADFIKVMASGGVLDDSRGGLEQQFTDDELRAIVETAHNLGRKVAAHAHGPDAIRAALRAGVDSIEHGTLIDGDGIALLKAKGAYLVPTLVPMSTVSANLTIPGYYPDAVREKALTILRLAGTRFQAVVKARVKLAFGTDAGVIEHGCNAFEFAFMINAGLTPMEAIRAATINAADLLGIADEAGSLKPGMVADIIAVDNNPLDDITVLTRVRFVMKGGIVYKGIATDGSMQGPSRQSSELRCGANSSAS